MTLSCFDWDGTSSDDKLGVVTLDLTPYGPPAPSPAVVAAAAKAGAEKKAPAAVAGAGAGASGQVFNNWLKLEQTPASYSKQKQALIWVRFECNAIQKAVRRKKEAMGVDGVNIEQLSALFDVCCKCRSMHCIASH